MTLPPLAPPRNAHVAPAAAPRGPHLIPRPGVAPGMPWDATLNVQLSVCTDTRTPSYPHPPVPSRLNLQSNNIYDISMLLTIAVWPGPAQLGPARPTAGQHRHQEITVIHLKKKLKKEV